MPRSVRFAFLIWVAAALASCAKANGVQGPSRDLDRPNIVLILADDLGWGDLGINGADLMETPNIDRIGREGVRLTSFYAGSNVCTPSRAALLTGRYAFRSGMQHIVFAKSQFGLPADEITIAELLRDAGYATGMIGKWHLGHSDEHWPTNQGFDEFYGVPYSNDMQPFDLYEDKAIVQSPVDQGALSSNYADKAAAFISAHANEPFFLYYAETFPHIPLHVPADAAGRSDAGLYGDVIEHMDATIGRVLDALDQAGVADNTLIIFTSDNGPWFEGDPGTNRGRKGETYEGGYRVPFLARWPAALTAGEVSNEMAMAIDLLPTLARIGGAELPRDRVVDGHDIMPLLANGAPSPHEYLYFFNGNEIAAVRDRRHRLVLSSYYKTFSVPFERLGSPLLFDLERDPKERFNYARDNPEALARLTNALQKMRGEALPYFREPENPFAPPDDGVVVGPRLDRTSR